MISNESSPSNNNKCISEEKQISDTGRSPAKKVRALTYPILRDQPQLWYQNSLKRVPPKAKLMRDGDADEG